MFFKLVFVLLGLLCLSECKPIEDVSLEEYDDMEEFGSILQFFYEMARSIKSFALYPVYELFSMFENEDPKNIANPDFFPFEFERAEESREEQHVLSEEMYDDDFDLELVMPILTASSANEGER